MDICFGLGNQVIHQYVAFLLKFTLSICMYIVLSIYVCYIQSTNPSPLALVPLGYSSVRGVI